MRVACPDVWALQRPVCVPHPRNGECGIPSVERDLSVGALVYSWPGDWKTKRRQLARQQWPGAAAAIHMAVLVSVMFGCSISAKKRNKYNLRLLVQRDNLLLL